MRPARKRSGKKLRGGKSKGGRPPILRSVAPIDMKAGRKALKGWRGRLALVGVAMLIAPTPGLFENYNRYEG